MSKNLVERDIAVNWHPYTQMQTDLPPIPIVKGEGSWLIAQDGTRYLDAISSWWVNLHGHNNPYIMKKLREQTSKLDHVIFSGFTHPQAIELSENLLEILPKEHQKIFYSDNGSTAVEVGIKMAIQYHYNQKNNRGTLIALKNGYHGDTFGSMSSGGRGIFSTPFENHLFNVEHIDVPTFGNEEKSLKKLKDIISSKNVYGFIFEPLLQGAAGMVIYSPKVLSKMIKYCKENDVISISDEVSTGFGRTGKFFAADYLTCKPDIICMSKGLTGGVMALGATSTTDKIYNAFLSNNKSKMFLHGHSYTGNPLACSVAIASLKLLHRQETWTKIKMIRKSHIDFIRENKNNNQILDIRNIGVILAITIKSDSNESYFNYLRDNIYDYFIKRKIILRPLGNVIYVMPPYCISSDELQLIYFTILELLKSLES
ncbi:MAG: adenosylmethionine--8-amino-7-oxononanoate transaminase [Candidatus Marinimicrobia bacterium]|nr:adenosylmethionine--8-amino-7-oxononanoate transaminase [Candidatus Neomarinimicrobiota bacterium]|tara:strand:+ start:864 stop:2147 length:1284 start_codon:yes stop_codon:yes gene_type:complete